MKASILTTASLLGAFAGTLPAADPQLMKLVMPDVRVMSDINVAQAKQSPLGQFLLGQMETARVQQFASLTGFDPRSDLMELLVVSNGSAGNSLALASGVFNQTAIASAAQKAGAVAETYKGVTIFDNAGKTEGIAFLNGSVMLAGNVANVKAAIDRQAEPATLPASMVTQANQLSVTQDAWMIFDVPPASLFPAGPQKAAAPIGGMAVPANILQQVQSGYAGVKFGANVALTVQTQSDTAENAAGLAGLLQFAGNMAQMQAAKNPDAAAFAKSLTVTSQGTTVNISASVPSDKFQQLLTSTTAVKQHLQIDRK